MLQWLFGYIIFLVWLFSICAVTVGLKTALWGFLFIHIGCAVAAITLCWHDERRWGKMIWLAERTETGSTAVPPAPQPAAMQLEPTSAKWLSLNEDEFNLLESYTDTLTDQVSAVYPLVARDHVHKIVWTVMIELFCKRAAQTQQSTPASLLASRIAKAA